MDDKETILSKIKQAICYQLDTNASTIELLDGIENPLLRASFSRAEGKVYRNLSEETTKIISSHVSNIFDIFVQEEVQKLETLAETGYSQQP